MAGIALLVVLVPLAVAFGWCLLGVLCAACSDIIKGARWLLLLPFRLVASVARWLKRKVTQ